MFQTLPTLSFTPILLVISPFVGSFIANFAMRLPDDRSVLSGRSCCMICTVTLPAVDLLPILSWARLHGKCRYCRSRISALYPVIELATLLVALWSTSVCTGWIATIYFTFGCFLLVLAVIDAQHYWLPNVLTLPLIPAGIIYCWLVSPQLVLGHMLGAAVGFLVFFGVAKFYRMLRGIDGLGLGDAKLLAGLGAWVSWWGLPLVISGASIGGLCFALWRNFALRRPIARDERIPFGPFLALSGWLVFLYGSLFSLAGW